MNIIDIYLYLIVVSCAHIYLTLILPTRRIWWAHNKTSRWQTWFNSAFKGL